MVGQATLLDILPQMIETHIQRQLEVHYRQADEDFAANRENLMAQQKKAKEKKLRDDMIRKAVEAVKRNLAGTSGENEVSDRALQEAIARSLQDQGGSSGAGDTDESRKAREQADKEAKAKAAREAQEMANINAQAEATQAAKAKAAKEKADRDAEAEAARAAKAKADREAKSNAGGSGATAANDTEEDRQHDRQPRQQRQDTTEDVVPVFGGVPDAEQQIDSRPWAHRVVHLYRDGLRVDDGDGTRLNTSGHR